MSNEKEFTTLSVKIDVNMANQLATDFKNRNTAGKVLVNFYTDYVRGKLQEDQSPESLLENMANSYDVLSILSLREYKEMKGKLSLEQLNCLCEIYKGIKLDPQFSTNKRYIITQIEDAELLNKVPEMKEVNSEALILAIESISNIQAYSLLSKISEYWEAKQTTKYLTVNSFFSDVI